MFLFIFDLKGIGFTVLTISSRLVGLISLPNQKIDDFKAEAYISLAHLSIV